ncbi:MAG: cell division topological specificity factor MinE [Clostridiales bacterium GWE2_32_10]|nr:MAG: cell division topological specificity factor MinE [Clostridiales bacterium GWE2_32_10]HBY20972.1 cell division topological specificity factor MinE [Clostridiales bacterium]
MFDITKLLNSFGTKKEKSSGNVAKDRLKLVLVHDRSSCSGEILEKIRADIMEVISRYMDIDTEGLDIQISQTKSTETDGNVPVLYANIPIKSIRKTE